jgi:murein L,D-transpeptidase YafK
MRNYLRLYFIAMLLICAGCSTPPEPQEIHYLKIQQAALMKACALEHAPDEYKKYRTAYWNANNTFIREDAKFRWFKDFTSVRDQFRLVLSDGNKILIKIKAINDKRAQGIAQQIASLNNKVASLKESTAMLNEARLIRKNLSKAEVLLSAAEFLYKKGDYDTAETKLKMVKSYSLKSMDTANSILSRYMDKNQVAKWRKMAEATIDESKRKGIVAIIVSKIDHDLIVYRNGKKIGTYDIGLGRNALKDKLYAGDGATPEGRYYIVKKNGGSRYYKALLFDYPNNEDRIRFNAAKKNGIIPTRVGIGSLVEIHGGGSGGMTRGCISLDNNDMDKLFAITNEGTPVTIVGAVNGTLDLLSSMKNV